MRSTIRTKAILIIAIALVLFAILGSWQLIKTNISPPPSPVVNITIALNSNYPGSGLLYVAAARGFYAQEGLNAIMQPYTSGRDALNAAIEKRADLGTAGDVPIMFAAMDDLPVSIIATIWLCHC